MLILFVLTRTSPSSPVPLQSVEPAGKKNYCYICPVLETSISAT